MIFFISILFSLLVLLLENLIDINYAYHPDTLTYLNSAGEINLMNFFKNPINFLGSFYYVWVSFFSSNIIILIILNIFLFALTNSILFSQVKKIYKKKGPLYFIAVLFIIFDPYRAHLSVHILKDTMIIFSLVIFLFSSSKIISFFGLILGFMLRLGFFVYLPIKFTYANKKNFITSFLIIAIPFLYYSDGIISLILDEERGSMAFRSFDRVYNFIEIEYPIGVIMRSITWPIIRLTGLAALFHPIYLLFLFQSVVLMYLFFINENYLSYKIILFIIPLVGLAIITTGYNSYLRWSQPVITALSIWLASLPVKSFVNLETKLKINSKTIL